MWCLITSPKLLLEVTLPIEVNQDQRDCKKYIIYKRSQLFTFRAVTEIPFSASQIMLVASSDAVASRCVPGLNDNPLTWITKPSQPVRHPSVVCAWYSDEEIFE